MTALSPYFLNSLFPYLPRIFSAPEHPGVRVLFFHTSPYFFGDQPSSAALPSGVTGLIHFPLKRWICIST